MHSRLNNSQRRLQLHLDGTLCSPAQAERAAVLRDCKLQLCFQGMPGSLDFARPSARATSLAQPVHEYCGTGSGHHLSLRGLNLCYQLFIGWLLYHFCKHTSKYRLNMVQHTTCSLAPSPARRSPHRPPLPQALNALAPSELSHHAIRAAPHPVCAVRPRVTPVSTSDGIRLVEALALALPLPVAHPPQPCPIPRLRRPDSQSPWPVRGGCSSLRGIHALHRSHGEDRACGKSWLTVSTAPAGRLRCRAWTLSATRIARPHRHGPNPAHQGHPTQLLNALHARQRGQECSSRGRRAPAPESSLSQARGGRTRYGCGYGDCACARLLVKEDQRCRWRGRTAVSGCAAPVKLSSIEARQGMPWR